MINPLELAIIRGRLQQVVEEMDLSQVRAAFSPVVSEMLDRSNAIIDPVFQEVIMQGSSGLPIFVTTMQTAARVCLEDLSEELEPGDVVAVNDPYRCGTHLNDIKMVRPVFIGDELVALLANTGHLVDIGGARPGGFDPTASEIYQEGLQVPPVFLQKRGILRSDIMRFILQNTRLPEAQYGDLRAQLNALELGERRLMALIDERGLDAYASSVAELAQRSEAQMRRYLSQVEDGTYAWSDVVEAGPDHDLNVGLTLEFNGGNVKAKFSGTSPSDDGPMNLSRETTITSILTAFKHLFPDVPINGGCFRPFSFEFPSDCFLAAGRPRALGGMAEGAQRVVDAVFGALSGALPEVVSAAAFGTSGVLSISGQGSDGFFATIFPLCGGYGASMGSDGLVHATPTVGMARFPKLEASEHDYPIRWEKFEIRPDSGGSGEWRGGAGTIFRFEALSSMKVSFLGGRTRHSPFGVAGGGPAMPASVELFTRGVVVGGPGVDGVEAVDLVAGDIVEMRSPGGGGYGRPKQRSRASLRRDVLDGVVSEAAAEREYFLGARPVGGPEGDPSP